MEVTNMNRYEELYKHEKLTYEMSEIKEILDIDVNNFNSDIDNAYWAAKSLIKLNVAEEKIDKKIKDLLSICEFYGFKGKNSELMYFNTIEILAKISMREGKYEHASTYLARRIRDSRDNGEKIPYYINTSYLYSCLNLEDETRLYMLNPKNFFYEFDQINDFSYDCLNEKRILCEKLDDRCLTWGNELLESGHENEILELRIGLAERLKGINEDIEKLQSKQQNEVQDINTKEKNDKNVEKIKKLELEIEEFKEKIKKLSKENSSKDKKIESLELTLKNQKEIINQQKNDNKAKDKDIFEKNNKLVEQKDIINELDNTIKGLKQDIKKQAEGIPEQEIKITRLEKNINEKDNIIEKREQKIGELQSAINEFKFELRNKDDEYENLKNDFEEQKNILVQEKQNYELLNKENQELAEEISHLTDKNVELEKIITDLKNKVNFYGTTSEPKSAEPLIRKNQKILIFGDTQYVGNDRIKRIVKNILKIDKSNVEIPGDGIYDNLKHIKGFVNKLYDKQKYVAVIFGANPHCIPDKGDNYSILSRWNNDSDILIPKFECRENSESKDLKITNDNFDKVLKKLKEKLEMERIDKERNF